MKNLSLYSQIGKEFEWSKWHEEIPYIAFPKHLEVKVIPPFTGAIVRFLVRDKEYQETRVSVYLDCYGILGAVHEPYWEIYPYEQDVFRCMMNETEELIKAIEDSINRQIEERLHDN